MTVAAGTQLVIRRMERPELDWALQLAAAEGWNPGLDDADAFHRADPPGFFIALLDGRPIGCISAVQYQRRYGFLGLYIVAPEFRGRGYGMQLWNRACDYLADCRLSGPIGLDGVVAQQDNYRKSGFKLAHRNIRFAGPAPAPASLTGDEKGDEANPRTTEANLTLTPLRAVPFRDIAEYDATAFPAPRDAFLLRWIDRPRGAGAAWGVLREERLAGYGVIRPCRQGYKIGPLLADDTPAAAALLTRLLASVPEGAPVAWDVPEPNVAAVALAQKCGLEPVFETARMYQGTPPAVQADRCFGITTFELG